MNDTDDYEFLDRLKDTTSSESKSLRQRLIAVSPHKFKRWKQYVLTSSAGLLSIWYQNYTRYWTAWHSLNHKTLENGWNTLYTEELLSLEDKFDALNEIYK